MGRPAWQADHPGWSTAHPGGLRRTSWAGGGGERAQCGYSFVAGAQLLTGLSLEKWSPTVLAPGTVFVEDNFFTNGVGMVLG